MLKFSPANSKLKKLYKVKQLKKWTDKGKIYSFNLPAGFSCGFASDCHSRTIEIDGKLQTKDFPTTKFRCYAASLSTLYKNVYKMQNENFAHLKQFKTVEDLCGTIQEYLPDKFSIMRIHSSGDFYNENYFKAWLKVAQNNPDKLFYWYTKALPYWVNNREEVDNTPNFIGCASYGGRKDSMIEEHNLRYSKVVFSKQEAKGLKLPIDMDDSHASRPDIKNKNLALLIHGVQPRNSDASKALQKIKDS
jgi:hypothetical protein